MGFPMVDHIPSTSTQNPHSGAVVTHQQSAVNNTHNRSLQRESATSPLRKLSVDLIKTYKGINEVCIFSSLCSGWFSSLASMIVLNITCSKS